MVIIGLDLNECNFQRFKFLILNLETRIRKNLKSIDQHLRSFLCIWIKPLIGFDISIEGNWNLDLNIFVNQNWTDELIEFFFHIWKRFWYSNCKYFSSSILSFFTTFFILENPTIIVYDSKIMSKTTWRLSLILMNVENNSKILEFLFQFHFYK